MEGILIALAMMALFALIGSNRFVLLRKAADQAFVPFDKLVMEKYQLLSEKVSIWQKTIDKEVEETQEERKLKELESLLKKAQNPQLEINQKVKAENKITQALYELTRDDGSAERQSMQTFEQPPALSQVEKKLEVLKKKYNEAVLDYNNAVYMFPSNVFALIFRYRPRATFKFPGETREQEKGKLFGKR